MKAANMSALRTVFYLAAALVVIFGIAASAWAEGPAVDDDRLDEAWKDAIGDQEGILTEKQFAMLNNIAFQAAVTKICDGYELDPSKFAKAINDAPHRCRTRICRTKTRKKWV